MQLPLVRPYKFETGDSNSRNWDQVGRESWEDTNKMQDIGQLLEWGELKNFEIG